MLALHCTVTDICDAQVWEGNQQDQVGKADAHSPDGEPDWLVRSSNTRAQLAGNIQQLEDEVKAAISMKQRRQLQVLELVSHCVYLTAVQYSDLV